MKGYGFPVPGIDDGGVSFLLAVGHVACLVFGF
jgi:hypothetical protein